jgi:hypothetical protein
MSTFKVMGMDLSLRHGAVIELDEDLNWNHWYYTDRAGTAARSETGQRIPPAIFKTDDFHLRDILRLLWVRAWVKNLVTKREPYAVALEDYAYDAGQGSHQLGELGGIVRVVCWDTKIRLRLNAPGTVKMFGADNGNAGKELVKEGVKRKWGMDFSSFDAPGKPGKKQNTDISEDLTDAYVMARMAMAEVRLRKGTMTLDELGSDKERQAFLRTTSTFPVNVLGREWVHISRIDGSETG